MLYFSEIEHLVDINHRSVRPTSGKLSFEKHPIIYLVAYWQPLSPCLLDSELQVQSGLRFGVDLADLGIRLQSSHHQIFGASSRGLPQELSDCLVDYNHLFWLSYSLLLVRKTQFWTT